MSVVRLEIVLEYDAGVMYGNDPESREWFFNKILGDEGALILHSNEIGDDVGIVKVLRVERPWLNVEDPAKIARRR